MGIDYQDATSQECVKKIIITTPMRYVYFFILLTDKFLYKALFLLKVIYIGNNMSFRKNFLI